MTIRRRGVRLKVLYVDDEADIREVAMLALELDPDMEVRSESSGMAGLATASVWIPDAILLDVMMPSMDGPTTLILLRNNHSTRLIPVIFVTARAQSREIEEFIRLGAREVITKPFNPLTLAADVRRGIVT
jgi:two-component system OmpR family response regulator